METANSTQGAVASLGLDDVLVRIKAEYLALPGLRLSLAQAQRVWDLDTVTCEALLGALVDARFLSRARDGSFQRRIE